MTTSASAQWALAKGRWKKKYDIWKRKDGKKVVEWELIEQAAEGSLELWQRMADKSDDKSTSNQLFQRLVDLQQLRDINCTLLLVNFKESSKTKQLLDASYSAFENVRKQAAVYKSTSMDEQQQPEPSAPPPREDDVEVHTFMVDPSADSDETKRDVDGTSSEASSNVFSLTSTEDNLPSNFLEPDPKFHFDPDATDMFEELKQNERTGSKLVKALKDATLTKKDPDLWFLRDQGNTHALAAWIKKVLGIKTSKDNRSDTEMYGEIVQEAIGMLKIEAATETLSLTEKANFIMKHIDGRSAIEDWVSLIPTMKAFEFEKKDLGELPNHEMFVGISAFTEGVEAIRPTIESLFRHGGNRTRRFHVVIVRDCLKHPDKKRNTRIDSQPYGVSWESPDKSIALTIINKGLSKYLAKFSSQYFFEKYKTKKRASNHQTFDKSCSMLTDTKTIFAEGSVDCMFQYMARNPNVIAVTGSQEVYPNKLITDPNNQTLDGVDIGKELHDLRPTWLESIYRGQAMQGFEYTFSYALNTLPFHYLGHLPILPGPAHFYDNEKMETTKILDEFVNTLLKIGEAECENHLLKLLYLAEDRLMSLLYGSMSKYTVAWVPEARFYYKPEPSWLRTMWQRVRWQPGTLAGFLIALWTPEEMQLIGHSWGPVYRALCRCEVAKIVLCCSSNIIWALVTEFSFRTNPLPVGLLHGTVQANIIFPVIWSAWAALVGFEIIGTGDPGRENFLGPKGLVEVDWKTKCWAFHCLKTRKDAVHTLELLLASFMIALSLGLSAVTMFVNLVGLFLRKDKSSDGIALSMIEPGWGWLQWAAVSAFFALPMLAWIHVRQHGKALRIPFMIVSSLGTVLLFFGHHFGAVPLFSIVMCRCLKWRGNKVMPSEITTKPVIPIPIACCPHWDSDSHSHSHSHSTAASEDGSSQDNASLWPKFRGVYINPIKELGVIIVGVVLAIYFTGGRECLSFTNAITGAKNYTNVTNGTSTIFKPGSFDWSTLVQEPDKCCWGSCDSCAYEPEAFCHMTLENCAECDGNWCLAERIPIIPNITNGTINATNYSIPFWNEDKRLKKFDDSFVYAECLLPRLYWFPIDFEYLALVVLSPQLIPVAVGVAAWLFSTFSSLVGTVGCLRHIEALLEKVPESDRAMTDESTGMV